MFPYQEENRLKAEFFGSRPGYFVEVGAYQPQDGSQTWQFEQAGWDGVLVEPQPELAKWLRETRRAQVFAVACSSPANAGHTMRLHLSGPHSSLNPQLAVTGKAPLASVEVPVRTLDAILTEVDAPVPIDFVSIDVEGHEVDVLRGFDLARWQPRLAIIEDLVTSLATHRTMVRAGYRLMRRCGHNGWYVPRNAAPAIGLGWLPIARKYYLALPIRILRDRKRRLRDRIRLGIGARQHRS